MLHDASWIPTLRHRNEHLKSLRYPLVISHSYGSHGHLWGILPWKMAIFHSFLYVYQRISYSFMFHLLFVALNLSETPSYTSGNLESKHRVVDLFNALFVWTVRPCLQSKWFGVFSHSFQWHVISHNGAIFIFSIVSHKYSHVSHGDP